ncbi:S1 family peptidase [Amycolatopsis taiwanensis]|uniref:S1 family peptidase n=1 Tax=Amycolatopsis taiwanensis TaxID=342230 RepID=UPI00048392C0|nr:S1 family peptidase [Amycolatopsis taiwanensis]
MKVPIVVMAIVATASLAAQPADALPSFVPLNAGLLPAMQRDLGLTHDQAVDELTASTRASRLEQALRSQLGDAFGGAMFRPGAGRLEVAVTDPAKLGLVRASGADVRQVRYSARQLDAMVARLNAREAAAPRSITSWGVDTEHNRVTVGVEPGHRAEAERFLAQSGAPDAFVVERAQSPRPQFGVSGGDAYYVGANIRCSVGFAVTIGFLSAGHCAANGRSISGYNREPMGYFVTYSFPGEDYSLARVNPNWMPLGRLANGTRVAGSIEAPVGASVCKDGSTTGWTCGRIEARNQTVRYEQGEVVGAIKTDLHAGAGDSGSPLVAGNQAQGLLSGGDDGSTYFYPVRAALFATGSTLVTG